MVAHNKLRERDRRRHAGVSAEDPRGVPPARRVLDQPGVARAEEVLSAVAQADLELAGEDDDELAARGRVPVEVLADRLDARLAVGARVEPKRSHRGLPSVAAESTGC